MNGRWTLRYYSKHANASRLLTWEREFARCAMLRDFRGANLHWKGMVNEGIKPNRKIVTSYLQAHVNARGGSAEWHPDIVHEYVDLQDHSCVNVLLVQAADTLQSQGPTVGGIMDPNDESDARVLFEFVKDRHTHDDEDTAAFFWEVATYLLKSRTVDDRSLNMLLLQAVKERNTPMIEKIAARINRARNRSHDIFSHATMTLASIVTKGSDHALKNLQSLKGVGQNKVLDVMLALCQGHPQLSSEREQVAEIRTVLSKGRKD